MYGKKTGKRLLSWVLVLIMALSMLPLNVLAGEVGGTGRYVALVDFNTNATVADAGWQDVSTEAGHTAILTAINDLKPNGGTNLETVCKTQTCYLQNLMFRRLTPRTLSL